MIKVEETIEGMTLSTVFYNGREYYKVSGVTGDFYNITGLNQNTRYNISTHTVDNSGNVNLTWVNLTVSTLDKILVTNLRNASYAQNYINWTWTNPVEAPKLMLYLNSKFRMNVSTGGKYQQSVNTTGLLSNTPYTLSIRSVDKNGVINKTWVNHTARTAPDITPPASVTNLTNASYAPNHINWTWTDPKDPDFARVMIYIDGKFKANVSKGKKYYNATGLIALTRHTISTRTVDTSGNINLTWVNHTARTRP